MSDMNHVSWAFFVCHVSIQFLTKKHFSILTKRLWFCLLKINTNRIGAVLVEERWISELGKWGTIVFMVHALLHFVLFHTMTLIFNIQESWLPLLSLLLCGDTCQQKKYAYSTWARLFASSNSTLFLFGLFVSFTFQNLPFLYSFFSWFLCPSLTRLSTIASCQSSRGKRRTASFWK